MIPYELLRDLVQDLYLKSAQDSKGLVDALKAAQEQEQSAIAKTQIKLMLEAIRISKAKNKPLCPDCGYMTFHIKVGSEVKVPKDITKAIQEGMAIAIEKIPLSWKFGYHPITGAELPLPHIYYGFMPGKDYIEIVATPKGSGSEPYSSFDILGTAEHIPRELGPIKKFVLDTVRKAGPRSCPPYIVGVGIGGSFESAPLLAKEATCRIIGQRHSDSEVCKLEEELLDAINELGYGPMGIGGKTTALSVNIEVAVIDPRWRYIPVGVNIKCWPNRWGMVRVYSDNRIEYV